MIYAMTKLYAAIYGSAVYEKWLLLCCEYLDMHMQYTLLKNYCLCFELPGHGWYFAQSLPTFPSPQALLFFFLQILPESAKAVPGRWSWQQIPRSIR